MMEDGRQGASGWWPLAGGLLVAVADALFAWGFWRGRGASLGDIFRSVAAGLYGDAARASEGAGVAWIGAGLHLFIGITMVVAYALVARRWRPLVERPWLCGSLCGVAFYLFMNCVVLPLSAAGAPSFAYRSWVASSVLAHAVFGLIAAFAARRFIGIGSRSEV